MGWGQDGHVIPLPGGLPKGRWAGHSAGGVGGMQSHLVAVSQLHLSEYTPLHVDVWVPPGSSQGTLSCRTSGNTGGRERGAVRPSRGHGSSASEPHPLGAPHTESPGQTEGKASEFFLHT